MVEHDKQQTNKKSEILEKKNESDAEEIPDWWSYNCVNYLFFIKFLLTL